MTRQAPARSRDTASAPAASFRLVALLACSGSMSVSELAGVSGYSRVHVRRCLRLLLGLACRVGASVRGGAPWTLTMGGREGAEGPWPRCPRSGATQPPLPLEVSA